MMWCATLQRCLELRLEEHAPIDDLPARGERVVAVHTGGGAQESTACVKSWSKQAVAGLPETKELRRTSPGPAQQHAPYVVSGPSVTGQGAPHPHTCRRAGSRPASQT